ncbi:GSCFA domain-containing protein [Snuella sedimenti]|uniref:GSCFA domain-containing protein n=1 Tax=Snuella sedimenti TaxID=2798802 RepID=A0A8J7IKD7_9FLAO|nr:GSCFA domain-containing protein [Snuella sedimenti]MBJ6369781.1 GSCFA domain-containing protein [Snuella sedimenti]
MNLQTQIPLEKQSNNLIDYTSSMLLLGSCFIENIGEKSDYFKFKNTQNPFGILFHPKAIENLLRYSLNKKEYAESDVFLHNEQWHCFDAHSKLSHASKDTLLHELNANLKKTFKQLSDATHVVITLGTAWMYRFIASDAIVANCHKVPQKQFKKELMSVASLIASLDGIMAAIRSINENATVIFTVSPVRHIKDGFIGNMQSKAHLITAIHQFLNNQKPGSKGESYYFPSYEIIMDELRDYRFYKEDMLHPNAVAINYVWEKFKNVWVADEATKIMDRVDAVQKGLLHKPFNYNSEAHQKFLQNLEIKIKALQSQFPHIVF